MGRPENITLEKYLEANSSDERMQIVEDTFAYIKELEKQYNMRIVSSKFKEKHNKDIEELEKQLEELDEDEYLRQKDIEAYNYNQAFISGKIRGLKSALNYY